MLTFTDAHAHTLYLHPKTHAYSQVNTQICTPASPDQSKDSLDSICWGTWQKVCKLSQTEAHTHTNIHTHTQTHSPVNTPKRQHLQINPTNSTATAAELHHIQPTLEISKVLMMKSVYLAVSTMRTLTSPYFMVPSSGQYCSHFFCKTHHDHQVTKSNFPLQGPTYSHVSKHWYSCNACDF